MSSDNLDELEDEPLSSSTCTLLLPVMGYSSVDD